jgi:hypothetical protein
MKKKKVTLSLRVDQATRRLLETEAEKRGQTLTQVAELALELFLAPEEGNGVKFRRLAEEVATYLKAKEENP